MFTFRKKFQSISSAEERIQLQKLVGVEICDVWLQDGIYYVLPTGVKTENGNILYSDFLIECKKVGDKYEIV